MRVSAPQEPLVIGGDDGETDLDFLLGDSPEMLLAANTAAMNGLRVGREELDGGVPLYVNGQEANAQVFLELSPHNHVGCVFVIVDPRTVPGEEEVYIYASYARRGPNSDWTRNWTLLLTGCTNLPPTPSEVVGLALQQLQQR